MCDLLQVKGRSVKDCPVRSWYYKEEEQQQPEDEISTRKASTGQSSPCVRSHRLFLTEEGPVGTRSPSVSLSFGEEGPTIEQISIRCLSSSVLE